MVINTSCTICHLFVSTVSLSFETPALVRVLSWQSGSVTIMGGHLDSTGRLHINEELIWFMRHASVHPYGRGLRPCSEFMRLVFVESAVNTTASSDLGEPRPDSCS